MFSRLTFVHRKAHKDSEPLNETDKRLLISTFIQKLTPRLSQLLMSEESTLTYDSVSSRAIELEQIFCLNTQSMDIMAVIDSQNQRKTSNGSEITELIKELRHQSANHEKQIWRLIDSFSKVLSQSQSRPQSQQQSQFQSKPRYPPRFHKGIDVSKLQGFCQFSVLDGSCQKENYRYKHSNIPQEILNLKTN